MEVVANSNVGQINHLNPLDINRKFNTCKRYSLKTQEANQSVSETNGQKNYIDVLIENLEGCRMVMKNNLGKNIIQCPTYIKNLKNSKLKMTDFKFFIISQAHMSVYSILFVGKKNK